MAQIEHQELRAATGSSARGDDGSQQLQFVHDLRQVRLY